MSQAATSEDGTVSDRPGSQLRKASSFAFDQVFSRDNPGRIEDYYTLDDNVLGEGSFGSVCQGVCKNTKAVRAIKTIDTERFGAGRLAKFEKEIEIARQLDHPNVVRLYETFRDAKSIYLVMELCTGKELFDRIIAEASSGFDEYKAARYIREMLAAVCYLHSQKFAHRDVKPENFMLQNESKDSPLKIIDFGFSCRIEPGTPMTTKHGTAYYVAPEVLAGSYDERCDVWSIGVVSFILLCGQPPFYGRTDHETMRKVKQCKYSFNAKPWERVSQDAKNFITSMLTYDYTARPSASTLLSQSWLQRKAPPEAVSVPEGFVQGLTSFQANCRLKKVALAVVAQQLPDSSLEALKKTFIALDTNGDGMLSAEEMRKGLEQEGIALPANFDCAVRSIDLNQSGALDYTEFIAATLDRKVYKTRDVCWAAFRKFDLDGDGKITCDELRQVLNNDGVRDTIGVQKIQAMIQEVDKDGDGCIDFEEFLAMMGAPDRKRRRLVGKQSVED